MDQEENNPELEKRLRARVKTMAEVQRHQLKEAVLQTEAHISTLERLFRKTGQKFVGFSDDMLQRIYEISTAAENALTGLRDLQQIQIRNLYLLVVAMIPAWALVTWLAVILLPIGGETYELQPGSYTIFNDQDRNFMKCQKRTDGIFECHDPQ